MVQLPKPTLGFWRFTRSCKRQRPVPEQKLCLWLGSHQTPCGDRLFHFRLVLTCPSFTETPRADLSFPKETETARKRAQRDLGSVLCVVVYLHVVYVEVSGILCSWMMQNLTHPDPHSALQKWPLDSRFLTCGCFTDSVGNSYRKS